MEEDRWKILDRNKTLRNPLPRIDELFLLDVSRKLYEDSYLFGQKKQDVLTDGVSLFASRLLADERLKDTVEVSFLGYSSSVRTLYPFQTLDEPFLPRESLFSLLKPDQSEPDLLSSLPAALQALTERRKTLRAFGIDSFAPWLIVISADGKEAYDREKEKNLLSLHALEDEGELHVLSLLLSGKDTSLKTASALDLLSLCHEKKILGEKFTFPEFSSRLLLLLKKESRGEKLPPDPSSFSAFGEI